MKGNPTGILLLNLGGPDSLKAVKPFLFNLFSDRDIIRLGPAPLQKPIAWFISSMRSGKTQEAYQLIGGGSPIRQITSAQAEALQSSLGSHGDFRVYVGMRYWHPYIADTIKRMHGDGIEKCIALSLYPQYSVATTGSAYKELQKCLKTYPVQCVFTGAWYSNASYINSIFQSILRSVGQNRREFNVLYSAHSLPKSFIAEGDPYVDHIKGTVDLVNAQLSAHGYTVHSYLSYQSRSGPVEWLEPSTDEMIEELGKQGVKELIVVPISFVSDHIETLYEIDILYRELALEKGIILKRTESLNTDPAFIDALKGVVLEEVNREKG